MASIEIRQALKLPRKAGFLTLNTEAPVSTHALLGKKLVVSKSEAMKKVEGDKGKEPEATKGGSQAITLGQPKGGQRQPIAKFLISHKEG